jgi:hypothetical protein
VVFFSSVADGPGGLTIVVFFSIFVSSLAGGFTIVVVFFSTGTAVGTGVTRASHPDRMAAAITRMAWGFMEFICF